LPSILILGVFINIIGALISPPSFFSSSYFKLAIPGNGTDIYYEMAFCCESVFKETALPELFVAWLTPHSSLKGNDF
jgi:hypothetical protein